MSSSNQTHGLRALRVRRLAAIRRIRNVGHQAIALRAARETLPQRRAWHPLRESAARTRPPLSVPRRHPFPRRPLSRVISHTTSKSKSGTPTTCGAVVQSTAGVPRVNSFTGTPIFLSHAANWQSASPTYAYKPPAPAFADVVAPVPDAASATANITPSARPADFQRSGTGILPPLPPGLSPRCWTKSSSVRERGSSPPCPVSPALLDSPQQRFGAGKEESPFPAPGEVPPRCWTKSSSVRERGSSSLLRPGASPALLDSLQQRSGAGILLPLPPVLPPALLDSLQHRFGTGKEESPSPARGETFGSGDPPPPCLGASPALLDSPQQRFGAGKEESPFPAPGEVPRAAGLSPAAFGSGDPPPPLPGASPALLDSPQQRFGAGKEESPFPAPGEVPPRCWTKSSSVRGAGILPPPCPGASPALLDSPQQPAFGSGDPPPPCPGASPALLDSPQQCFGAGKEESPFPRSGGSSPPRCWTKSSSVRERGSSSPRSQRFPRAAGLAPAAFGSGDPPPPAPGASPALLDSLQQRSGAGILLPPLPALPRAAGLSPAAFGSGDLPPLPPQRFGTGKEESPFPAPGEGPPRCWTRSSSIRERGSSSPCPRRFPRAAGLSPAAFGSGDPPPLLPVLPPPCWTRSSSVSERGRRGFLLPRSGGSSPALLD
ncbi:hypothetical protein C8R44DRAFT_896586 [Mycena epipterygia]|nr:hypothetical protein C8R44DRAFT_896586 [Mycena epipterygia]